MSSLLRFEPWDLVNEINKAIGGNLGGRFVRNPESTSAEVSSWVPAVDITEEKDKYIVLADVPGIKREDIDIRLQEGNVLTITGHRQEEKENKKGKSLRVERTYGSFIRSFTLPNSVDAEKISASVKDGELVLVIPKKEISSMRRIEVN